MHPALKVCCIASLEEARVAVDAGASVLGLVSAMPSGPGVIDEAQIARIAQAVRGWNPAPETFLLSALRDAAALIAQHQRCGTTALQLVDRLELSELRRLRETLQGVGIVQVIHVTGLDAVDEARACAPYVDAILLDSGNPALAVKELGGTGRVHDWSVSRQIRDAVTTSLWLAGGLNADNAAAAIAAVQPDGLDICSGVRTQGHLDAAKLRRLVASMRCGGPRPESLGACA